VRGSDHGHDGEDGLSLPLRVGGDVPDVQVIVDGDLDR
jgi:hypothetical protein